MSAEPKDIKKLVTENLDIWTSAIKSKSRTGRGSNKTYELYGIKKLRELILDLAVRGLLVPQDPNDEPASELLKKIAVEKEQLIKEGKIKKLKALPPIKEEEMTFELPDGWQWKRFPDLCFYNTGKTPPTKNPVYWSDDSEGYPWVSIADMTHYQDVYETKKQISEEATEKVFKYEPVKAGTLIMSFKLTVGKVSRLAVDAYHNEAIISVHPFNGVDQSYLYRFLPIRAKVGNTKKAIKGNTLNSDSLAMISLPLPPLAEQKRIVAKVDELMALCDQLEQQTDTSIKAHKLLVENLLKALTQAKDHTTFQQAWQRIAKNFDTLFTTEHSIDQLKQTILQLAVMGKLAPQDPNDEPASELLKKIATEKEKLIKQGKIKKQKPLPEISEEEKPFELPEGWEWVSLSNLISVMDAGWSPACPPEPSSSDDIWGVLKTTAVQCMEYWEHENKVLSEAKEPKSQYEVNVGDILITRAGPKNRVGVSCLVDKTRPKLMISDKIIRFHLVEIGLIERYISLCLNAGATANYIENAKSGMAESQMNISQIKLKKAPVPLCPINEQRQIVVKFDELMNLCDKLKSQIADFKKSQTKISDSLALINQQ